MRRRLFFFCSRRRLLISPSPLTAVRPPAPKVMLHNDTGAPLDLNTVAAEPLPVKSRSAAHPQTLTSSHSLHAGSFNCASASLQSSFFYFQGVKRVWGPESKELSSMWCPPVPSTTSQYIKAVICQLLIYSVSHFDMTVKLAMFTCTA